MRGGIHMKRPSLWVVILYGICAVIWTLRAILEIVYQTYNDSVFWFALNTLCSPLWIIAFILCLKSFLSKK